MDPVLIALPVFFAIAIASAVLSHAAVRNFFLATAIAAVAGTSVAYGIYGIWRGYVPGGLIFVAMLGPCAIVAAGVGIPFYRRRTGRGLGQH